MLSLTELESLRDEFIRFLVVNGIDALQWEEMKSNDPVGYGAWLEKFSDLVMDDVLTRVQYIDHYESGKYRVFRCEADRICLIGIDAVDASLALDDFMSRLSVEEDGFSIFAQCKPYQPGRNEEIYRMLSAGARVTQGEWFDRLFEAHMP